MHLQHQLFLEAGHIEFGHHGNLDNFADAQQVVQIESDNGPFVDQYATVLPPKIQRPYPEPQFPPTNPPK